MDWIEHMYYFNEEWNPPLSKEYLVKRGSCCANGCLNCPYTDPKIKGNRNLKNEKSNINNSSKK